MPQISQEAELTRVRVELGDDSYDVLVGQNLLGRTGELAASHWKSPKRCAIVTDANVGPLYGETVSASLKSAGFDPLTITVPAGEPSKSMPEVENVCRQMLAAGLDRSAFVVALGGGVIGDLAGFCAAILSRGVPYLQIPTTVLSQVDSSVGGKTGVNVAEGKNLLGAFHQPKLVIADTDTLQSLPGREYREGYAEIIKHAAIRDADMIPMIAAQGESRENLAPLIARNVAIKAAVVEEDEKEISGVRALLNFGHTIGHAIEAAAGYGELLHGEAISLGVIAALRMSEKRSSLTPEDSEQILQLLDQFQLPKALPNTFNVEKILKLMQTDKKFVQGQIRFVLLPRLGDAFVSSEVTQDDIRQRIEELIVV